MPTAANAGYYAEIVAERAILRRLVEAGTRIVQMGYGGDGDIDDVVDRAQAEIYDVTERRTSEDYVPIETCCRARWTRSTRSRPRRIPSACPPASPSWTSSPTACTRARWSSWRRARRSASRRSRWTSPAASIKHNLTTVMFSLEMGRNEITMRLLSAEARVPLHHMRSGTMTDDDWNRLARTTGSVSAAPLFIDDSPNMTLMEIRAKCRRLKQRHDLKLVILDYLQLMTSGKRVESRQQEVASSRAR